MPIISRRILFGVIVIVIFCVEAGPLFRLIVALCRLLRSTLGPTWDFCVQNVYGPVLLVTIRLSVQETAGSRTWSRSLVYGFA